jgi:hypothetical protein
MHSENTNHGKDKWDKGEIIAKIGVAVAATIVTVVIGVYGSQINKALGFRNHDFLILQQFHNIFPEPNKRRLAVRLLDLLVDKDIEFQTRAVVFWDILDKNIYNPKYKETQSFNFNPDTPDWHYLGENTARMFFIKPVEAKEAFIKFRKDAKKSFVAVSKEKEIDELFDWLKITYPQIGEHF